MIKVVVSSYSTMALHTPGQGIYICDRIMAMPECAIIRLFRDGEKPVEIDSNELYISAVYELKENRS